jgi:hypothetical protein
VVEVIAGAIGYGAGAFVFANALTRDLLRLAMDLRKKRRAKADAAATSPESSA